MTAPVDPEIVVLEECEAWRVGHKPDAWDWTPWRYANGGHFEGRWDAPDGTFRTLYAGDSLLACLLEILACFRPDPELEAALDSIDGDDTGSRHPAGSIPRSWLDNRCAAKAQLVGRFCAVTHSTTIAALRPRFLPQAIALGLDDFDAAALRDSRPRSLTQQVAAHLFASTAVDGIEFASRHGDDHRLWAIFERTSDAAPALCLRNRTHFELTGDHPAIAQAFATHRLRWEDKEDVADSLPLTVEQVSHDQVAAKMDELFGDRGPTTETPLGAACLFHMALQDLSRNREALEYLVYHSDDWGDYSDAARALAPLSIAENAESCPDEPAITYVKFIQIEGDRSVRAFATTPVPDATILTLVRPLGDRGEWKVWGYSHGFFPDARQVRGDDR